MYITKKKELTGESSIEMAAGDSGRRSEGRPSGQQWRPDSTEEGAGGDPDRTGYCRGSQSGERPLGGQRAIAGGRGMNLKKECL